MQRPKKSDRPAADRARRAQKRGLDEVFHYFIPEAEQSELAPAETSEAIASANPTLTQPAVSQRPWVLIAEPSRPLHCWLAADLLLAMAATSGCREIAASFDPPALFRPGNWRTQSPSRLANQLSATTSAQALFVLRRDEILQAVSTRSSAFEVLLPVDPSEHGIQNALTTVAALSPHTQRVYCLLIGTAESEATDLHARLEATSIREHGVEIVYLGSLPRGRDDDRALLEGVSILDRDPGAPSARALQTLGWSLADSQAHHDA